MKKTLSDIQAPTLYGRRLIWGASLLSLCVLPACSDSDSDDAQGGETEAPTLTTSALDVDADAAAQAQRVTNFRIGATRAVAEDDDTEVVTLAAGAKLPAEIPAGKTYVVEGELELEQGSTLTIKGGLKSSGIVALPGVTVVVEGGTLDVADLRTRDIVVNSGAAKLAKVLIAQSAKINGGEVSLAQDASFPTLAINGEAKVTVATGATITVEGKLSIGASTVKIANDVDAKTFSYIKAETLSFADADLTTNFGYGYFAVLGESLQLADAATAASSLVQPASLQLFTSIAEFKSFVPEVGETGSLTVLEQTSIIKNGTDKANLSATGIAVDGNNIYVSFHNRGGDVNGAIDVATIQSDGSVAVSATLSSTDDNKFEFNHIAVAGGKVYAVGNREDSGLTAEGVQKDGGKGVIGVITTTAPYTLSTRNLYAGDGNSIILNGDYLQVASTYGVETYAVDGLRREAAVPTAGHVKSIIKNGSNVVTLSYSGSTSASASFTDKDGNALTETPFVVSTYASYDYTFQNASTYSGSFAESAIVPINGKNTIAADGDYYYVAAGANGLLRSDGKKFFVARNQGSKVATGYANSVTIDDSYVYVAYGSAGVYVLNKSDLSEVASYKNTAGKSANFIAVSAGKIFVAYGEDSWQVLQLATVTK